MKVRKKLSSLGFCSVPPQGCVHGQYSLVSKEEAGRHVGASSLRPMSSDTQDGKLGGGFFSWAYQLPYLQRREESLPCYRPNCKQTLTHLSAAAQGLRVCLGAGPAA